MCRCCILQRLGLIQGEEKGKDHPPKGRGSCYIYRGHLAGQDVKRVKKKKKKKKKRAEEPVRIDTNSAEQGMADQSASRPSRSGVSGEEVGESIGGDVDERLDGDSLLGNRRLTDMRSGDS
jgi:hypothetical protein